MKHVNIAAKRFFSRATLVLVLALTTNCATFVDYKMSINIKGHVYEKDSEMPIGNARIELVLAEHYPSSHIEIGTTNAQGYIENIHDLRFGYCRGMKVTTREFIRQRIRRESHDLEIYIISQEHAEEMLTYEFTKLTEHEGIYILDFGDAYLAPIK